MFSFLAIFFLIWISICVALNFLTLPGNWFMAVFVGLWAWLVPENTLGLTFWIIFLAMLIAGEFIEFFLQIKGAKKGGCSRSSNVLGIVGAIAGAIFFAPFFLGIGAIFGALAGAWTGCFIGESLIDRKPAEKAIVAANAALVGKFLGMIVKFGIGAGLVVYTAASIMP